MMKNLARSCLWNTYLHSVTESLLLVGLSRSVSDLVKKRRDPQRFANL
jgi:hypothetical protein